MKLTPPSMARVELVLAAAGVAALAIVASAQTVTPSGTTTVITAAAGDQTDPHISGSLVSYTSDLNANSDIRFHNLASGSDTDVPNSGEDDFLSDVSGSRIVFTRVSVTSGIYVYDTAGSGAPFELAPSPTANRRSPAIGNLTVAWLDFGFRASVLQPEIVAHNLATDTTTRLTNDELLDRNVAVSAEGSVIVWAKCQTTGLGCDIWQATMVGGMWTSMALTGAAGEERLPDTSGQVVVYASTRGGETDIYLQPVGGGAELRLEMAGVQTNPNISGNVVAFEHFDPAGNWDVYAYDISTGTRYRITATGSNETLNDIFVSPTGEVRIVYASDATGDSNVHMFTFQLVAASPNEQLTNLLGRIDAAVSHDGLATSLKAKLQSALAKLGDGQLAAACNTLNAFINEVQAQSGKKIMAGDAMALINDANEIRAALGCP
jgi:Tol biopolymer transport system component